MAAHQKKARDLNATLAFTDETGILVAPLARRTQARRSHTPILHQRAAHREKVSVAAALTLSPVRRRPAMYYQPYPDMYVDSDVYAHFLRNLLWHVRGDLVLVHDGGMMHKGPPIRAVLEAFPRLHLHLLPPYAPELNPVEYLWTDLKYHQLPNFVPENVAQIEQAVFIELEDIRHDQPRLRTYFASSPLPWHGLM